jgi:hypothetical protein
MNANKRNKHARTPVGIRGSRAGRGIDHCGWRAPPPRRVSALPEPAREGRRRLLKGAGGGAARGGGGNDRICVDSNGNSKSDDQVRVEAGQRVRARCRDRRGAAAAARARNERERGQLWAFSKQEVRLLVWWRVVSLPGAWWRGAHRRTWMAWRREVVSAG